MYGPVIAYSLLTTVILLFIYAFYKWGTSRNDFFEKRGISYVKPIFLLGNTASIFLKADGLYNLINNLYNSFPNEKIIGFFMYRTPMYLIRDPDIVKQLTIKDFDHFQDHKFLIDPKMDTLFGNTLFQKQGQQWRDMRATLSPAFTGSKMRQMFILISECADHMSAYLLKESKMGKKHVLEMKDLFSRFANDFIASCAFGIKVDSLKNPKNEFLMTGKEFINFKSFRSYVKFFFLTTTPKLMKLLNIEFINKKIKNFFYSIITETLEYREKNNIIRPDMINILLDVKNGQLKYQEEDERLVEGFATVKESNIGRGIGGGKTMTAANITNKWTMDELVAQCFVFFLGGFDTTSTVISALAYELAMNQNVQEKLCNEIDKYDMDKINNNNDNTITYEEIQKLKYLDMVVSELLRLWSPALFIDRICTKDYKFNDGTRDIYIKKGEQFWVPIYGFHLDEKYYPNPRKFDPERFSDDNKHNINLSVYLPFGSGPRNCIGSRLALVGVKTIAFYLLRNFTFEITTKTQIPLKMVASPLGVFPLNGLYLELRPRNN